ncbi:MAG: ParB/RepB/Spo0J family partition protein [Phycisphaerae bacterium]|nr:ParB/RepB/Spo0J family partition protein [Phycisphaerae bacterium]
MAETRKRLGRGLDSLLSSTRLQELDEVSTPAQKEKKTPASIDTSKEYVAEIELDRVKRNPHQPRSHWDEEKLLELADSIKANGLIQPILVRPMGKGFQLIAGERRLRATKMAGIKKINAIVRHASEEQMLEWALIENIHRADLGPLERALAYKKYLTDFSLSSQEAAQRLGEDRSTISNYVRLLVLPEEIKEFLSNRKLSMGHARALLGLADSGQQMQLAVMAVEKRMSVRELERRIQDLHKRADKKTPVTPPAKNSHILDLETEMTRSIGTKVTIKTNGRTGHKGKIIIDFYNLDDFDRLREILA